MKKSKMFVLAVMLSLLATGIFAGNRLRPSGVGDLYAYNGSGYYLLASGSFTAGFTTVSTGTPSAITDASGNPRLLCTRSGSFYYPLYSTSGW